MILSTSASVFERASADAEAGWFMRDVYTYHCSLRAFLRSSFPQVRDYEDIVQESFLRILLARRNHFIRSPRSFLFQIAKNLAIDAVRHGRASPLISCPQWETARIVVDDPEVVESACIQEELHILAEAIHILPARIRTVLILRQIQEKSPGEIAAKLGLSPHSIQKYMARGLNRIKWRMHRHEHRDDQAGLPCRPRRSVQELDRNPILDLGRSR